MPTLEEPTMSKTEGKINYKIIGSSGDDRLSWDRRFLDQIKEARDKFYELVDKGYKACVVTEEGKAGDMISKFDPNLEEIIFIPLVRGG